MDNGKETKALEVKITWAESHKHDESFSVLLIRHGHQLFQDTRMT